MYELLSPVEERAKWFWIGSREFDPVHLGFTNDEVEGAFRYDTSEKGNHNLGHEFREAPAGTEGVIGPLLTAEQRLDIIEYLKVLRSVQDYLDSDPDPYIRGRLDLRNRLLDVLSPFYESNTNWSYYGETKPKEPTNRNSWYSMNYFCQVITKAEADFQGQLKQASVPATSASPYATPAKGK
jgi:hypothetical protein